MELPVLNFPKKYNFQIKEKESLWYIFDEVRKKWLILTPEEWVRQHIIFYFKTEKKIPQSAFIIEKKINLNQQTKRLDILLYKKSEPRLLVECKAPEIPITQTTFEQAARYNTQIKSKYILLTNGFKHLYFTYDAVNNQYKVVDDFDWS
ncbi:type I restriction enzyme HsdR N-terminal domain-containing protein [Apibacter sp. B3706]|uniref:type I restriction enzyme HsdR N-terminal domain-containing protein n=1 Tax=Apibacter sp. B3706 TaxID=2656760 RepID=UPI00140D4C62|nr:type I restriction enzyme HsdR N-terminal domain-containing protein [Apibacter sp. B3706]QII69418.1 type I restriction enzyme HsdR N-terminal domain-containing protein [Apibacter sp. B3706]